MTETDSSSWPILRRAALLLCIVAGLFIGIVAALAVSDSFRTLTVRTTVGMMGTSLPRDADGFTNILLLGVGDAHHDGADLTDTMIVASIDERTRSAVLLSLPRDLLIDSDTRVVSGRINAIYANEKRRLVYREELSDEAAAQQALVTVGEVIGDKLGITIHGIVKADFTAFTEAVDSIGGVDIDVPEEINDYTYPLAEDRVGLFHVDAGLQHFDGETALRYARSRHSTSDFDRSARQQQLLAAIGAKASSLSILRRIDSATDLYNRLQGHITSTLDTAQLILLAQIGSTLSRERIITMQLNFSIGGDGVEAAPGGFVVPAPPEFYEGASVLLPLAAPGTDPDWKQIQTFTAFLLQQRSLSIQHPVVAIRELGTPRVQSWRLRNELLRYGWQTLPPQTGSGTTEYASVYYRDPSFEPAASFLGQLLSLPVARATDDTGSGDILLSLGSDFRFRTFATLSGAVLEE